jgi:hypothetical protein
MGYEISKDLKDERTVEVEWHGADTRVMIDGDGVKTDVKKGDVITVSIKQAKALLVYDRNWTFAGDKPKEHAFDKEQERRLKEQDKLAKKARKGSVDTQNTQDDDSSDDDEPEVIDLEALNPETMSKDEVVNTLKALGVSHNSRTGEEKLKGLLIETITEKKAEAEADAEKE